LTEFYRNFPKTPHKRTAFITTISGRKLQQTLIHTFQKLNKETFRLEDIACPSLPDCTVTLEFGIAQAGDFNFLDDGEADRVLKTVSKTPFQMMDFLCAVRYHKTESGQKKAPRFDYYIVRFVFYDDVSEMQVFHERGPRHVIPEDITNLIMKRINESSSRKIIKFLEDS
jgi:hypothetical protein